MGRPAKPFLKRLRQFRRLRNGCWQWTAGKGAHGYGAVWIDGRTVPAHRAVYEMLRGKIPEGLEMDHLCRNRACVNPDHLEPVTHAENIRRGWVAKKERESRRKRRAA